MSNSNNPKYRLHTNYNWFGFSLLFLRNHRLNNVLKVVTGHALKPVGQVWSTCFKSEIGRPKVIVKLRFQPLLSQYHRIFTLGMCYFNFSYFYKFHHPLILIVEFTHYTCKNTSGRHYQSPSWTIM